MKIYYDDGECGRLIGEVLPSVSFSSVQCVPFSEIALAVVDYCIINHIDNPDYEHILIVSK